MHPYRNLQVFKPNIFANSNALPISIVLFPFSRSDIKLIDKPVNSEIYFVYTLPVLNQNKL